jgi:nitrogen fixation NifU-like protein
MGEPGTYEGSKVDSTDVTYSATVLDHIREPRNAGSMANADGHAMITGPCGDTMSIWLRVRDGVVNDATFWTDGCGTTVAAGSMATELAKGRKVAQALTISQQELLDALEGLPEDSVHCALLAANTLRAAVRDYLNCRNEPWKRAYRKFQVPGAGSPPMRGPGQSKTAKGRSEALSE